MIDFVFAGALYIAVMFAVCFVLSFVTIAIAYIIAKFTRGILDRVRTPHPALK
jgi:hypothetical protein